MLTVEMSATIHRKPVSEMEKQKAKIHVTRMFTHEQWGLVEGRRVCRRGWLGLAHLYHLFIPSSSHRMGHMVITPGRSCAGHLEGTIGSKIRKRRLSQGSVSGSCQWADPRQDLLEASDSCMGMNRTVWPQENWFPEQTLCPHNENVPHSRENGKW